MAKENRRANPADQYVANMINLLVIKASHSTCDTEERQTYINQIAQLRASMNPMIIQRSE